jgi:hypothetical protein
MLLDLKLSPPRLVRLLVATPLGKTKLGAIVTFKLKLMLEMLEWDL